MNVFLNLWYTSQTENLKVSFNDEEHELTAVNGKSVEELAYPFVKGGVRWRGLYEELRSIAGCHQFTLIFHGSDDAYEQFKELLADNPVDLVSSNNKVVILYNEKSIFTKITINGKIMPTNALGGVTIDRWVHPFEKPGHNWKGIFAELDERLGGMQYSITFVGNPVCMNALVNECPDNVDITFKPPVKSAKSANQSAASNTGIRTSTSQQSIIVDKAEIANSFQNTMQKIKNNDTTNEADVSNIPIKNPFIRNNIMTICAGCSLLFCFFPFVDFVLVKYSVINILGSEVDIFGKFLAFLILLGPVLIAIMNYIQQVQKYKGMIAVITPIVCALAAIILLVKIKTAIGRIAIGFILLFVSYIATVLCGAMCYWGFNPFKKQ